MQKQSFVELYETSERHNVQTCLRNGWKMLYWLKTRKYCALVKKHSLTEVFTLSFQKNILLFHTQLTCSCEKHAEKSRKKIVIETEI